MDPATILVLVLCVGGLALLVWFEINSRKNEASMKQSSPSAPSGLDPLQRKPQSKVESAMDKAKTA